MLTLRILVLNLTFLTCSSAEFSFSKNNNNYGPYIIRYKNYEECQGPKAKNATTVVVKPFFSDNNSLSQMTTYNITFHTSVRLTEVKIYVYRLNGAQKTTLWHYNLNNPCQHFAIAAVIAKYVPLQNNCIIKKGEVYFTVNFTALAHQFFGPSFFYGEFAFKALGLATQGNIMCLRYIAEFIKTTPTTTPAMVKN